jgi:hypothetical protein
MGRAILDMQTRQCCLVCILRGIATLTFLFVIRLCRPPQAKPNFDQQPQVPVGMTYSNPSSVIPLSDPNNGHFHLLLPIQTGVCCSSSNLNELPTHCAKRHTSWNSYVQYVFEHCPNLFLKGWTNIPRPTNTPRPASIHGFQGLNGLS